VLSNLLINAAFCGVSSGDFGAGDSVNSDHITDNYAEINELSSCTQSSHAFTFFEMLVCSVGGFLFLISASDDCGKLKIVGTTLWTRDLQLQHL